MSYREVHGYDEVDGSIGSSYDEMKGVTMTVNVNFDMLSEIKVCVCTCRGVNSVRVKCKNMSGGTPLDNIICSDPHRVITPHPLQSLLGQ